MRCVVRLTVLIVATLLSAMPTLSQDASVKPDVKDSSSGSDGKKPALVFPIIATHGGVVARPQAVEQPRKNAKVVFDTTADAKPADVNKGLDRVARLLNLYGAAGLTAKDVTIAIVLHGEATKSVLSDAAYKSRFQVDRNPNLPLIRELQDAGVEVLVCGQALNYKSFPDDEVADGIAIAAAALTVVINKQTDGYAYIPVP
jgi:intracellular sulfur oxidation DsrE/DsrF family protein